MTKKNQDRTYEQSFAELTAVVERLQSGELPLEETITLFERGVALSKECESYLENAGRRVEVLLEDRDGNSGIEEFDDLED
ncbi:MAG: exodeoxyribonuclease VII small subunit [Acidobacteria bacterium]|nr:exodeoxyribonuclease VII small subunit [Acidobacteriota bacterium]